MKKWGYYGHTEEETRFEFPAIFEDKLFWGAHTVEEGGWFLHGNWDHFQSLYISYGKFSVRILSEFSKILRAYGYKGCFSMRKETTKSFPAHRNPGSMPGNL